MALHKNLGVSSFGNLTPSGGSSSNRSTSKKGINLGGIGVPRARPAVGAAGTGVNSRSTGGRPAPSPVASPTPTGPVIGSDFLQNVSSKPSNTVSEGLGKGADLRPSASTTLDSLSNTGLLTDVSKLTEAAQLEGANAFGDIEARIMSALAATGGADSSASVARLSEAGQRISSNIGIEGLRASVGAQENASNRRVSGVDLGLSESGLNINALSNLGNIENNATGNAINANIGAGNLDLGARQIGSNEFLAGQNLDFSAREGTLNRNSNEFLKSLGLGLGFSHGGVVTTSDPGVFGGFGSEEEDLRSRRRAAMLVSLLSRGRGGGSGNKGSAGNSAKGRAQNEVNAQLRMQLKQQKELAAFMQRLSQQGETKKRAGTLRLAQQIGGSQVQNIDPKSLGVGRRTNIAQDLGLAALRLNSDVFGFSDGGRVPGMDSGEDTIPAMLTVGEGVIPVDLTDTLLNAQTNEEVIIAGRDIQRMLVENVGGEKFEHGGQVVNDFSQESSLVSLLKKLSPLIDSIGGGQTQDTTLHGTASFPGPVPASLEDQRFPEQIRAIATPEGAVTPLQPEIVPSNAAPIAPAPPPPPVPGGIAPLEGDVFTNQDLDNVSAGPSQPQSLEEVQAQQLVDLQRSQQAAQEQLQFAQATKDNALANLMAANPLSPNYPALVQMAQQSSQAFEAAGGVSQESDKILAEVVNQQQLASAKELLDAHQIALDERQIAAQESNAESNARRADDPRRDAFRILLDDSGEFSPEQKEKAERLVFGSQATDARSQQIRDGLAILKMDISADMKVAFLEQAGIISKVDANFLGDDDIEIQGFQNAHGSTSVEDELFRQLLAEGQAN